MSDLMKQSPLGTYVEHLKKGELAYQVNKDTNKPHASKGRHCSAKG